MPQSWLIHVLQIYKIDPQIINSLQQLMKKWTTTLQVKMENHWIISNLFCIQRGIYQRNSLSPLWFFFALNPLSYLLNRTNYDFGIHSGNQEMQRLSHFLYMDDINYMQLQTVNYNNFYVSLTIFQDTLKWYLGLKSSKILSIAKGKLEMRNFTKEDDDGTMEAMNEGDMYRYLHHRQAKQIIHVRMKRKLGDEHLNHTKSL